MTNLVHRAGHRLLLEVDPERAHALAIKVMKLGIHPRWRPRTEPSLATSVLGLDFSSPIGVAAGFDKSAEVPDAVLAMGFGFVEVGTVTPRPQTGNPRPRIVRARKARALVNRLGFNNDGLEAVRQRLEARRENGRTRGIVGVNIGANKDAADRVTDYVTGYRSLAHLADYVTVNVSSPNTPGLRDLEAAEALDALLAALDDARVEADVDGGSTPLLVKVSPDVAEADILPVSETIRRHRVDGVIVSNSTVTRPQWLDPDFAREPGGLSGRPLFRRSTVMLARFARALGPTVPLIGVGGVMDGEGAFQKIAAGASLVQVYTGLAIKGPRVVRRIHEGLADALAARGIASPAEAVGVLRDDWASVPLADDLPSPVA